MADISAIKLPNGTTYEIKDAVARSVQLSTTYTAATQDLAIEFEPAEDADNEDF